MLFVYGFLLGLLEDISTVLRYSEFWGVSGIGIGSRRMGYFSALEEGIEGLLVSNKYVK